MVPKKWANIYARKKGRDLYYLYKFLGTGTKNTKEGLRNPWMNVQTMDGEEVGFKENDVEWVYGNNESAPVPSKTFTTFYNHIPVNAKMLTDDKTQGAYVNFIPQEEWNQ